MEAQRRRQPIRRRAEDGDVGTSYRTSSRMIAYLDIVLTIMDILGLILFLVLALATEYYFDLKNVFSAVHYMVVIVIIFVLVHLIFSFLELWIAIGLLTATDPDTPIQEALSQARLWRNFKTFLTAWEGILIGGGGMLSEYVGFTLRVTAIATVHQFIRELELEDAARADDDDDNGNRQPTEPALEWR